VGGRQQVAGIIGHRSWLAMPLFLELEQFGMQVHFIDKLYGPHFDFSQYDMVFLIAGRARPTDVERAQELQYVSDMMAFDRRPRRLVYVSSSAVLREPTPYAQTKMACENLVLSRDFGYVVRPPVIFGPGQDPDSNMLVPSIARAKMGLETLELKQPVRSFNLMHVKDVAYGLGLMGRDALGEDVRILNLNSQPVTPINLIAAVAPGIPLNVCSGWSASHQLPYDKSLTSYNVYWDFSAALVRETIDHYCFKRSLLDQSTTPPGVPLGL
jgi:nucleoside-diphosphate-sugar epimerase